MLAIPRFMAGLIARLARLACVGLSWHCTSARSILYLISYLAINCIDLFFYLQQWLLQSCLHVTHKMVRNMAFVFWLSEWRRRYNLWLQEIWCRLQIELHRLVKNFRSVRGLAFLSVMMRILICLRKNNAWRIRCVIVSIPWMATEEVTGSLAEMSLIATVSNYVPVIASRWLLIKPSHSSVCPTHPRSRTTVNYNWCMGICISCKCP